MKQLLYNNGEVVGAFFLDPEAKQWADTCPPNTPVTVEREATNKHDPYAVRVLANGIAIGYIPKDISPMVALFVDAGYTVEGEVNGRIGKRSRGNQAKNPAVTLYGTKQ